MCNHTVHLRFQTPKLVLIALLSLIEMILRNSLHEYQDYSDKATAITQQQQRDGDNTVAKMDSDKDKVTVKRQQRQGNSN